MVPRGCWAVVIVFTPLTPFSSLCAKLFSFRFTARKKNYETRTILSNGYLGSPNDEERSEMRYVMRIAESSESSKLWTHLALPFGGVCLLECLFIPPKIPSGSFWSRMCHSFSLKKPQIPRWQMNKNSTSFILFEIMFSFFYTKESYYSNTMTMRRHNYLI